MTPMILNKKLTPIMVAWIPLVAINRMTPKKLKASPSWMLHLFNLGNIQITSTTNPSDIMSEANIDVVSMASRRMMASKTAVTANTAIKNRVVFRDILFDLSRMS